MDRYIGERIGKRTLTRRDFIWLTSIASAGFLAGCATNPVTGEKQLMLMTKEQEISVDKENSPHQFSADYGALQITSLNEYISSVGNKLAGTSHRPEMPYSFRGVNATYINAYAFPGGSIAATRGILLSLDNEAELAALLGHEIGHVNARHTAERMTKTMLTQAVVAGVALYTQIEKPEYAPLAAGLGGLGAGLLLAKYSRDDERQADALGLEYMTRANENPSGMVGLMEMLQSMSQHKPNAIEVMFSTHPMSENRLKTAKESAATKYEKFKDAPVNKERYMDNTQQLRKIKGAIEAMQQGEALMMAKKFPEAEGKLKEALKIAPRDYAGLLLMSKCQLAMNKNQQAEFYANKAKNIYPKEPQANHILGVAQLQGKKYSAAFQDFDTYEKMLPGNPNTVFLKAVTLEGMQRKNKAAQEYKRYLNTVNSGEQAEISYQKLVDWGYIKPPAQQQQQQQQQQQK